MVRLLKSISITTKDGDRIALEDTEVVGKAVAIVIDRHGDMRRAFLSLEEFDRLIEARYSLSLKDNYAPSPEAPA